MHWRITLEAVDPTGDNYRKEFVVTKDLDGLTEGKVGCGIEDGKSIMAQIRKIIVERELDLWCGTAAPVRLVTVSCRSRTTANALC